MRRPVKRGGMMCVLWYSKRGIVSIARADTHAWEVSRQVVSSHWLAPVVVQTGRPRTDDAHASRPRTP